MEVPPYLVRARGRVRGVGVRVRVEVRVRVKVRVRVRVQGAVQSPQRTARARRRRVCAP